MTKKEFVKMQKRYNDMWDERDYCITQGYDNRAEQILDRLYEIDLFIRETTGYSLFDTYIEQIEQGII